MNTIQEVVPMRGSEQGIALLIDSWRNQIKYDQQYREFQQMLLKLFKEFRKKIQITKVLLNGRLMKPTLKDLV